MDIDQAQFTDIKSDNSLDLDMDFNHNHEFSHDAVTAPPTTANSTTTTTTTMADQPPTPAPTDADQSQSTQNMWTTPTSQGLRPRPATIHEGFSYCMSEAYDGLTSWDTSSTTQSQSRPVSMHQEFEDSWAQTVGQQKPLDDSLDLQHLVDSDMSIGQAYTTDEAIPILDLRFSNTSGGNGGGGNRRLSGSSFTMSTTGGLSDMPSYEDFSAALSDAPSFSSDYPPPSNRNSLMSSTQLSPVASPRMTPQSRSELVRTQSRGRASPSPRPGLRAAPYSMEGPRNKRWSTGSYGTMPSRRPSPFIYHGGVANNMLGATSGALEPFGPRLATSSSQQLQSSPTAQQGQLPLNMGNLQQASVAAAAAAAAAGVPAQNPYFLSAHQSQAAAAAAAAAAASGYNRHSMLLPTQLPSQAGAMAFHHPHLENGGFPGAHHFAPHPNMVSTHAGGLHPHTIPSHHLQLGSNGHLGTVPSNSFDPANQPAPLLSHGLFRMLQSNADPHSLHHHGGLHHHHYADLSDPPDLYASLHEEQLPPPPEDMNPSDPDLMPHEQELRFTGDLYTPKWVRGHGNKREGWCGICKPGRWLVLKNSAFWYDKSFTHGISAATGNPFQEPLETRRMDGNPDVWEGLCGSCNDWIALVSSKKKGTTWFRHAYKCHTHPKIKDAPKRRRESSHARAGGQTGGVVVKSRPNSQCGPGQLQVTTTGPGMNSGAPPMPHTPLTPQLTPVPASATTVTPTPTTATSSTAVLPVQMPVPVSLTMAGLSSMPSTAEQMMVQQQQQQSSSPSMVGEQQQPSPQDYAHLPPSHPPPSHPPPPVPPRSHLRMQQAQQQQQVQQAQQQEAHQQHMQQQQQQQAQQQQHMAQMEAMQQHHQQMQQQAQAQQQQQRNMQHVRPPPPPPQQARPMMTPMASIEGLGNMI
ncbi:hypothetical protein Sste5344_009811 [Sporothrix stenoceras]